jgi:transposase InsO family protein
VLKHEIERVHADNYGVYGAGKVWLALNREGIAVARCTVKQLMAELCLSGAVPGHGPADHDRRPGRGELAPAEWIDWFNHRRLYEYCGDIPPAELEATYYAQSRRPTAG